MYLSAMCEPLMSFFHFKKRYYLFLIFLLAGCSRFSADIPLDVPVIQVKKDAKHLSLSSKTIQVGVINDFRGLQESNTVLQKKRQDAQPQTYSLNKPVSSVIEKALYDTLRQQHYSVSQKNADYILTGNILDLNINADRDWSKSKLHGLAQLVLRLTDVHTGRSVWVKRYVTDFSMSNYLEFNMSERVGEVIAATVQNLMQQFAASSSFQHAIMLK